MNDWTWDNISEQYMIVAKAKQGKPFGDFAQGMLDIIPELRSVGPLDKLRLGLTLQTLTIGIEGKARKVHIDWSGLDLYEIYLNTCDDTDFTEAKKVPSNEVAKVTKDLLKFLEEAEDC